LKEKNLKLESELKTMSAKITQVKEELEQKILQNAPVFGSVDTMKKIQPLFVQKPLPEINIDNVEIPTTIRIADLTPKPEP